MSPFQYVVIVGCGRLGSTLANRLSSQGSSVVVIDQDDAAFAHLSAGFSGFLITGDATELDNLRRAKIDRADCLLAVTRHDNVNLMVAQVAKSVFQVSKVIARVFDPSREEVYRQFEIETICPTILSTSAFLDALQGPPEREPS